MSKVPDGNDVEEAKVEVEYDEPTDEREIRDTVVAPTTTTTTNSSTPPTTTTSSLMGVQQPEGASPVENNNNMVTDDDIKKDDDTTGGVKQIQMTVAADAPWKDRLWEGSSKIDTLHK